MKHLTTIFSATLVAAAALLNMNATAQTRSISDYRNRHSELIADQSKMQERIKVEETQRYTKDLYNEIEPEPDIYTEGWNSGRVNPYKEEDVPNTKVINVTHYAMPFDGNYVTSHYGYRAQFRRTHKGVDLRCAIGDTVRASFEGKVRLTNYDRGGYGFYVIVRHENGLETVYGHLSKFLVEPNQYVKAGQAIALSGNTGGSTGPHLHFETRFMGYAINPEAIFDFENRTTITDTYTFSKSNYQERRSNGNNRYRASNDTQKEETAKPEQPKQKPAENKQVATKEKEKSAATTKTEQRSKSKDNGKKKETQKKKETKQEHYTVRNGDSLEKIAKRNGTTVAEIKKLNNIKGNTIQKGQKIRVK